MARTKRVETPLQRWIRVADALKADGRSLKELSPEEQQERLAMLRGIGRGILPSSEEFARAKRYEVALERSRLSR